MKQEKISNCFKQLRILIVMLAFLPVLAFGQQNILINMATIDELPITPDNIFGYQIQATQKGDAVVRGRLHYRNSNLSLSYTFQCTLFPGLNIIHPTDVHPQWQFSSSALQELFTNYKVLPEGTFEYCVTITPGKVTKEQTADGVQECLYHRQNDIFLINLISPANKEKLKEYNPMLSWVANYSFSNDLSYRLRVAEIKQGQNPINAILRNQPVYEEKNLIQNSIIYPIYAKPLAANQRYAWTVDAYYKNILLGGAETWEFIIPDDTIPDKYPVMRSYIDVKRENGTTRLNIMGELKLKYILDKLKKDELTLQLLNESGEVINMKTQTLRAIYGDNRYVLNLKDDCNLKHLKDYSLQIHTKTGENYFLKFKYINPDFIR